MAFYKILKKYLFSIFILLNLTGFISCDDDSSSGPELIDSYKGKWVQGEQDGCVEGLNSDTSNITFLEFKDGFQYTKTIEAHDGKKCNDLVISVKQHGAVMIVGDFTEIAGTFKITKSITKQEYTHNSTKSVQGANSGDGYCGITDWVKGEAKDITNLTCLNSAGDDISSFYQSRELGKQNRDRDLMLLSEDGKTLYFGNSESRKNSESASDTCSSSESSENTEECFPTEIDESAVTAYTKSEDTTEE